MRAGERIALVFLLALPVFRVSAETPAPWRIVTSFYPVYIATLNVVGGVPGVELSNLTPPITGCLHDYSLTPEDLKRLTGADVFIVNGAGMESFLDKVLSQAPGITVVNASEGIELLDGNPHVWLSVTLAMKQVENIASGLAAADPGRAELYRSHAMAYRSRLEALRAELHDGLKEVQGSRIVTFHAAFPYFAREFGLEVAAVIEREPGSEPSARDLAETIDCVRQAGIKALFAEPQYPARAAQVIAAETGARICTLDPAVTGDLAPDAYLRIMERNLAELKKALK
jgi:zinc transport system substrate-binding protein